MKDPQGLDKVIRNVMLQIQSSRSSMSAEPGRDMYSPQYANGTGSAESPLNSLYRLIGLPAIRSVVPGQEAFVPGQLDYDGTINLFDVDALGQSGAADLAATIARELNFGREPQGDVKPTAANIERGLAFIHEPLNLDESPVELRIKRVSGAQPQQPRKTIFPMLVCGDVPVFPVNRRAAPLFGSTIAPGGDILPRTLLETIIYNRLGGVQDPSVRESVNGFELKLLNSMTETIGLLADAYKASTEQLVRISQNTIYVPAMRRGTRAGAAAGTLDVEFAQYSEYFLETPTRPRLDAQLADAQARLADAESLYAMLAGLRRPESDSLGIAEPDDAGIGVFITDLLDFAGYKAPDAASAVSEISAQIKSEAARADAAKARADMIAGESAGVGAVDVLATFCAIIEQPDNVLIGLLNNQARNRLSSILGRTAETTVTVADAISRLENSTRKYLSLAQARYLPTNGDKSR